MKNPVLDAIAARRSIRAYTAEQITQEQLNALLDAAQASPSASNSQPWHFSVVQNKALLTRINEAFRTEILKEINDPDRRARFEDPAYSVFFHAPTVIFVSCQPTSAMRYAETDCGMATENIALAAHSMGLGSVILGMPRLAFVGPEADEFRGLLGFPAGYDYILSIAVGNPDTTKEAHPILPDRITIVR